MKYILSSAAETDLEEIFDYTLLRYNQEQALKYLNSLEETITQLCANPYLGKIRAEIKAELRSIPKGEHTIYYHISDDHIRVVRVLHNSRDIEHAF
jgi:toxin ParE1/3/4